MMPSHRKIDAVCATSISDDAVYVLEGLLLEGLFR